MLVMKHYYKLMESVSSAAIRSLIQYNVKFFAYQFLKWFLAYWFRHNTEMITVILQNILVYEISGVFNQNLERLKHDQPD